MLKALKCQDDLSTHNNRQAEKSSEGKKTYEFIQQNESGPLIYKYNPEKS